MKSHHQKLKSKLKQLNRYLGSEGRLEKGKWKSSFFEFGVKWFYVWRSNVDTWPVWREGKGTLAVGEVRNHRAFNSGFSASLKSLVSLSLLHGVGPAARFWLHTAFSSWHWHLPAPTLRQKSLLSKNQAAGAEILIWLSGKEGVIEWKTQDFHTGKLVLNLTTNIN